MKTKKFTMATSLLLASSLLLAGCGGSKGGSTTADGTKTEGPKFTWRLAEGQPADYPTTLGDKKFAELVKERTNGRITIDVFPSAQLGEEKAVLEQVQLGAIELTRVNAQPLAEFNKQFGALSLPYVFDNDEHLWKFLKSDGGTKLLDGLESSRMKGLAYYSSGARSFYSRKPLTSINDLKGLKIRVQQSKVTMDMISALGANATPMAYGEVFSAIQTGVIDAAENNFPSFFTSNHYQSAKNMIVDEHQRTPEVVLISKAAWDKLPDADKQVVKQAALDSVDYQRQEWAKFEKDSEKKLRDAGVTITPVKDVKPWQDAVKPVIDKYGAEYKDVLDGIGKARK
jgi:tripartite ATP-independent transporter DctP family solute receptor